MRAYVAQGLSIKKALSIARITRHQYYHKPRSGRRGRPQTQETVKWLDAHTTVDCDNEFVVTEMTTVLEDPDTQYGYKRMAVALMLLGYMIGKKKVYRLMKEQGLLQRRKRKGNKKRVNGRRVDPTRPLELLEMDIKYVWVEERAGFAYILTVIDTFTRVVLHKHVAYHMTRHEVKAVWEYVIVNYLQGTDALKKGLRIEVRNDNGPQFGAKIIRQFFKDNHLDQLFTHPYTPQENGHIESFHAILSEHLNRFHFQTLAELESNMDCFYAKYNCVRLHGSIACLTPMLFWEYWDKGLIRRIEKEKKCSTFKLTIPYYEISGNESLREFPVEARRAS